MTVSVLALLTDVKRQGKPVVGFGLIRMADTRLADSCAIVLFLGLERGAWNTGRRKRRKPRSGSSLGCRHAGMRNLEDTAKDRWR